MLNLLVVLRSFIQWARSIFQDRQFKGLLLLVAIILAIGTAFYSYFEHWSILDAVYFCVITLTTVGYGDITPTQPLTKLFTIVYVVTGIGIILAFVNIVAKHATRQYLRQSETYLDTSERFIETIIERTLAKEKQVQSEQSKK